MKYTAFAPEGRKKGQGITARLIVRRVQDLNRRAAQGQGEMFPASGHIPDAKDPVVVAGGQQVAGRSEHDGRDQ